MLEADNLECLRGDNRLFAGLGFTLAPGELIYLQGRNGAGKTSLLRMLIGLLPPESGDIRWQGESIGKQRDEYHAALCYLGHHNAIKEELTPLENFHHAARFAGQDMDEDAALDALAQVLQFQRHLLTAIPDQDVDGRIAGPCERILEAQANARENFSQVPREFMLEIDPAATGAGS